MVACDGFDWVCIGMEMGYIVRFVENLAEIGARHSVWNPVAKVGNPRLNQQQPHLVVRAILQPWACHPLDLATRPHPFDYGAHQPRHLQLNIASAFCESALWSQAASFTHGVFTRPSDALTFERLARRWLAGTFARILRS